MKRIACLLTLAITFLLIPLLSQPRGRWKIRSVRADDHSLAAMSADSLEQKVSGDRHAAIAHSRRTGACGTSSNYATREGAERRALNECRERDCVIVAWARNSCAALAEGRDGEIASAYAGSQEEAIRLALDRCSHRGSDPRRFKCRLLCAVCA
jgi:serine/threonine-protein kinase